MSQKEELLARLTRTGLIAVIRARSAEQVVPLGEALVSAGIDLLEVTMTTPEAFQAIRNASRHFNDRALIGVGTVVDATTARDAIEAGANFVVTPICRAEIAKITRALGKPVMLGAYTPTEAQTAFEAGADFIKLFPAETQGPGFIKSLLAPLPHLKIVPTGGVTVENLTTWFEAGAVAVGIGSSLISKRILETNNWEELHEIARKFVSERKRLPHAQ